MILSMIDDADDDQLWSHIEQIKRPDAPPRASALAENPAGQAALLPLAEAVYDTMHSDPPQANGQAEARARLAELIRASQKPPPRSNFDAFRARLQSKSPEWRQALLLAILAALLLTSGLGYAILNYYREHCQ